jgi:hypothetical protein
VGLEGNQRKRLKARSGSRERGVSASSWIADVKSTAGVAAEEEAVAAVEGQGANAVRKKPEAGEMGRTGWREPDDEVAVEVARGVVGVEEAGEVLGQPAAVVGVVGEVAPGPAYAPGAAERPVREAAEDIHQQLLRETAAAALARFHCAGCYARVGRRLAVKLKLVMWGGWYLVGTISVVEILAHDLWENWLLGHSSMLAFATNH